MKKAALVVMAAGMASRYGGNKQIEGMGPHGEIMMEYSIYDAIRAGFTKVVFVIKPEMLDRMKEICGDRLSRRIEVAYAFQDFSSIPSFYPIPAGRVKPFGTVHAVLCALDKLSEPFAVINADDYYGVESFSQMYDFLTARSAPGQAAMMGYHLKNTVSEHGTVTRGICRVSGDRLTGVREVKKIRLRPDGVISDDDSGEILPPEASVSMNFWGFTPDYFQYSADYFKAFLSDPKNMENLKSEFFIPLMMDKLISEGTATCEVLDTTSKWFGVTYPEDRPAVVAKIQSLIDAGEYPAKLF